VRRYVYNKVGGLDRANRPESPAFNEPVDFLSLRVRQAGYLKRLYPFRRALIILKHTRGAEMNPAKSSGV